MSEIPEDIVKTARDIMDEACLPETLVSNGVDGAIRRAIARAILAERKRCAAAVRAERLVGPSDDPTDIAYDLAIEHAHAAIWRVT